MNVEFDFQKVDQTRAFMDVLRKNNITCTTQEAAGKYTVLVLGLSEDQYKEICRIRSILIAPATVADAIDSSAKKLNLVVDFSVNNVVVPLAKSAVKGFFKLGFGLLKTTGKLAIYTGAEILHQGDQTVKDIKESVEMQHLKSNFNAAAPKKSIRIVD